ncbi:acyl-CoA dehydrogenase family protein [Streptomyces sp. NPDC057908]|uniref:acyl-CoA dehydrogenase family protein n=1 Tax=Streptomyces sp. NPDC057908 TaxID=3346276 RepID=UPI0036ECF268
MHGFATQVVRPAAAEWDAREETPWPVIQEAAQIGLYGFESLADMYGDASGLSLQIANEELFRGDAGIDLALFGTFLAVAGIFASGTPGQLAEWVPQCYGDEDDPKVAAFSMSKLRAGELAVSAAEKAIRILGGAGYSREHPVERMYRDAEIYTIFEGPSEIQRPVIARAISGRHIR